MGFGNNRSLSSYDDIMKKIAELELKKSIQVKVDSFFSDLFEDMIQNIKSTQDTEVMSDRLSRIEEFVTSQLKIAEENDIYFSRKIEGGHSKKAKLIIPAESSLKALCEEGITKAFDKRLSGDNHSSPTQFRQLFGVYYALDNLTQTAFENVITTEQKAFKKQRRQQTEHKNNVYYKEIEFESK